MSFIVPIAHLHFDTVNARNQNDETDLNGLAASMSALGLLQPILVRPGSTPDRWLIVAGSRRVRAATLLGWDNIDAIELNGGTAFATAASAAENLVRRDMHPVDQWRAIAAVCSEDVSQEKAGEMLGIEPSEIRRLSWLGRMEPSVLDALGQDDLPASHDLRAIAMASHETQRAAMERTNKTRGDDYDWYTIAKQCRVRRVPMARALFNVVETGLVVDEDLFAEPGSPDQFTTTDIAGFLAAQLAALQRQADNPKKRMTVLAHDPRKYLRDRLPKGWDATWDKVPQRWGKDDTRRVFVSLVTEGPQIGTVESVVAIPTTPKVAAMSIVGGSNADRSGITKSAQSAIAALKGDGLRDRLRVFAGNGPADMLRALLLAFECKNIRRIPSDVAAMLVETDGSARIIDDRAVCDLAATMLANIVEFDRPDYNHTSGPAAEWIATAIGAELPRCDTADVLRGFSLESLSAIAAANGLASHGTASALRKRMAGAMPDWRPAKMGAPNVPARVVLDEDDGDGDETDQAA